MAELMKRCIRIFYISRKPTRAEYWKVAKVTGAGMALFGFIGFLVSVLFSFLR